MRFGQYTTPTDDAAWTGAVRDDDTIVRLPVAGAAAGIEIPDATVDLLANWQWRRKAELAVEYAEETGTGVYDAAEVDKIGRASCRERVSFTV